MRTSNTAWINIKFQRDDDLHSVYLVNVLWFLMWPGRY